MQNNNFSEDYKKGFQDGLKNKAISGTVKMLQIGLDKKFISNVLDLSEKEIAIIEETLNVNQHNVDLVIEETKNNMK